VADETIIDTIETKAAEAVEAVKAPVEATANAVEKAVAKPVRKVRTSAAKRRAGKAPAKVVEAATQLNKRAVKSAKRTRKATTQATAKAVDTQIERTTTMAYDFTKLFAGYELPGTDKFQTLFADASEKSQTLVAKSQKAAEEMTEIAKANVEALTEAGRIAATGAKTLGQDMLASSREGFEQATASVKTLADAKSPTEFIQIQSELARASFDRAVSESSKFAEAFVKLAGEAIQPLSTRATLNAERMGEIAA
jgi:phasin family protein